MKKILILGSSGLIGHQVYRRFSKNKNYETFNVSYRKVMDEKTILMNLRNENEIEAVIQKIKPDYIVNCVGVLIGAAEKDPENAIFLNAYMPHRLMRMADEIGAKFIHISTDCVFSGDKGNYIESDEKDGKGVYAKAKALGEIINERHLTLRTSVVGPELKSDGEELFHWFMQQKGTIKGYTKSLWSGVTTLELAKAVEKSIEQEITGLYHITNGVPINKYDLLILFKKYTHKDIEIEKIDGRVTNKSFIDTRKVLVNAIPGYDQMIKNMVEDMLSNQDSSQYKKDFM